MLKSLIFSLLLIVIVFNAAPGQTPQSRPNVVLIVSDDHGSDALGSYGNAVIKTPHLDNLAKDGTRFTSAYCTSASCSASRSVILSGLHNHANGMYGLQHSYHHFESFEDIEGLPNKLSKDGYRTARIGKFHIAPEEVYQFDKVLSKGAANDPSSIGRSPVEMANLCNDFINDNSSRPFFLYYATDDPHRSNFYRPDGTITFESYPDPNLFGNRKEGYPGVTEVTYSNDEVLVPDYLPDNETTRAELAQYYQSTSRLDQGVGRLIELLKEAGQYQNSLIIYISDNGPAFPASKTTLYEPGIRLPCIIKAPNQNKKGLVQDAMISWADLTPTILDYTKTPAAPQQFNGRSFKEVVEKKNIQGWDEVYSSHSLHEITMYYPMRMVRDENYKLIYNIAHHLPFPFALDLHQAPTWISVKDSDYFGKRKKEDLIHRPQYELYNLKNDPNELNNLAGNPKYRQILENMVTKIQNFQIETKDPWVHKWEYE